MFAGFVTRCLAVAALGVAVAGCQSASSGTQEPVLAASASSSGFPASGQRLGPDGYPQLGAYPNAAAPQVEDAVVAQQQGRMNAIASRRRGRASSAQYEADIARMTRLRQEQARTVDQALAERPAAEGEGSAGRTGPSRTPEEVLRRIEAGEE
ncbi:hypothetical protein [Jiella marina]|uniref:hypothetical protein n=1 Tax=Jiella sp. LLJ827 TaxID=2917712 RepID=UPI002101AC59|nr:hypothetical protein [Jiella sp. LLJ827]MCQ0990001.1 hypothetical protein [Jiella sp. LLJ827]